MAQPYLRHTAHIEGDFVVFLIGARLVKPWKLWSIIPVGRAMNATWRKNRKIAGARIAEAFAPLLAHRFENLVTAHGPPVVGGADRIVRAAIERVAAA